MDTVSNDTANKWPKVCQENTPKPAAAAAWAVGSRQNVGMLSCYLRKILTRPSECCSRNRDSPDQAALFPIFYCPAGVFFCCCGFKAPPVVHSQIIFCMAWKEQWLFELPLPFHHVEPVHPVSHSKKRLLSTQPLLTGYLLLWRPLWTLGMLLCENPSRSTVSGIARPDKLT